MNSNDAPLDSEIREFFLENSRVHQQAVSIKSPAGLWGQSKKGNIRELENMIERGSILAEDGGAIDTAQLFAGDSPNAALEGPTDTRTPPARHAAIHEAVNALLDQGEGSWTLLEQQLLRRAVELEDGNLSAAARRLGLSRPQLAYRLERKPAG